MQWLLERLHVERMSSAERLKLQGEAQFYVTHYPCLSCGHAQQFFVVLLALKSLEQLEIALKLMVFKGFRALCIASQRPRRSRAAAPPTSKAPSEAVALARLLERHFRGAQLGAQKDFKALRNGPCLHTTPSGFSGRQLRCLEEI